MSELKSFDDYFNHAITNVKYWSGMARIYKRAKQLERNELLRQEKEQNDKINDGWLKLHQKKIKEIYETVEIIEDIQLEPAPETPELPNRGAWVQESKPRKNLSEPKRKTKTKEDNSL